MIERLPQVAIDGPAGAGKSTVAKLLAGRLGFLYLDTGAMYRAATWLVLEKGLSVDDEQAVREVVSVASITLRQDASAGVRVFVDGKEITDAIRTPEISRLVSPLSTLPSVRELLVAQQQEIAGRGNVVLDGRDIGTVVLPDAGVKIFLTATPRERARRRARDLENAGEKVDLEALLVEINERDLRDSTRATSPLKRATDAIEIVSDDLTIEQVVEKIASICSERLGTANV